MKLFAFGFASGMVVCILALIVGSLLKGLIPPPESDDPEYRGKIAASDVHERSGASEFQMVLRRNGVEYAVDVDPAALLAPLDRCAAVFLIPAMGALQVMLSHDASKGSDLASDAG